MRPPPTSTRTDPLFPYTTLSRSHPPSDGPQPPKPAAAHWRPGPASSAPGTPAHSPPAAPPGGAGRRYAASLPTPARPPEAHTPSTDPHQAGRSEEHTSELQSLMRNSYAVFCLKKKRQTNIT